MAPKSERFELRLDETLMNRIDQWCESNETTMSRAEAVRELVSIGLDASNRHSVQLSDGEKLIIAMIADLSKDKSKREIDTKGIMDALYGGHYWALKWEHEWLLNDYQDKPGAVSFVVDVLDMWSFIEEACEKFTNEQLQQIADTLGYSEPVFAFAGFDGNYETEYMGIVQHLVESMGRFARFKGRSFNSHMPKVARYAVMTKLFEPMRRNLGHRRSLSVDEVIELLKRE